MPPIVFGRWRTLVTLLALALVLSACGQIGPATVQPATPPLSPAPETMHQHAGAPITAVPASETSTPQRTVKPTPPSPNSTIAFLRTSVARGRTNARSTSTAKALWALTPEPTIVPPAGTTRLRDLWPASPQAVSAPSRLYLRSPSFSEWKPDLFWEVRLPDLHLRRLPTLEQFSLSDTALVSPNGRFLAYVTVGRPALRLLDLTSQADVDVHLAMNEVNGRCHRPLSWSPDSRTLAAIARSGQHPSWTTQLLLFEPSASPTPQPVLALPGLLELLGWLDNQHLLMIHWSYNLKVPARLVIVDRQGNQSFLRELAPGIPRCSSLSPDGRDLIYEQDHRSFHLQLASGQRQPFSPAPDTFFWVGDGRTLLVSPFGRDRWIWVRSFDQPSQQQRLFLSPPYQAAYHFGITGISPDGSLLVACEQPPLRNPRIRSFVARTWLYDIAQDRWTHLRDNTTIACDVVVGWSSLGGEQ